MGTYSLIADINHYESLHVINTHMKSRRPHIPRITPTPSAALLLALVLSLPFVFITLFQILDWVM